MNKLPPDLHALDVARPNVVLLVADAGEQVPGGARQQRIPWAELLSRTFDVDGFLCPRCRTPSLRVVAVVEAPTLEELQAISAAGTPSSRVRWPGRSRAPPSTGQLAFEFLT